MPPAPQRRSLAHTLFCLCIAFFGAFVAYKGTQLSLGSLGRIGPGFFPMGLGLLICLLAVLTIFEREDAVFEWNGLRPLMLVSLAILFFAVTVERLGLAIAITGVVVLTSLAHGKPRFWTVATVTVFLCAVGFLLFINMLRIPLSLVP